MNIKNLPRWSVPLIILAIAFIMLALLIATKPAPPTTTSKEKAWQVSVQEVIFVDAKPQLELFAKSESPHSAQLKATLSAEVIALDALEGDTVEAGQTIIQLDPREASWKVQQRQADVDELKARILAENNRFDADRTSLGNEQKIYEIAKKASDRQARLRESNLVAQERYDIAASQAAQSLLAITQRKQSIADHPARLSQLKASLSRAMAFLNQAKFELEKSKIQTPFTSVLRSIASGLNISYHSLSNDLTSVNYSSIRQGALEDRSMYQIYQQFTIEHFVNPIFQSWLEMAISTGRINLPIGKFDKFSNSVNFIPRSFAWIDPLKEMQSNVLGLQNGTISYSDIAAAYGRDTEELFEQHQKEIELAKQYGIELAYQPFGQKQPVEANINGGDQDDE